MSGSIAYETVGTSALSASNHSHLRLVYDSRYDRTRTKNIESHKPQLNYRAIFVVAIVAVLLAGALSTVISNVRHARAFNSIGEAGTQEVSVCIGDTLWNLAQQHTVEGVSTGDVVSWIKEYNGLQTAELKPGQVLVVPSASVE